MTRYREICAHIEELACRAGRDPASITLVSVSKYQTIAAMQAACAEGCRHFGESRVVEALDKQKQLSSDLIWHLIGPLQRNKVSKVVGKFSLIHSVDSVQLAEKVAAVSRRKELSTKVLLEVNTSGEPNKHGLSLLDWARQFDQVIGLEGIEVVGLMTMAPKTEDQERIRTCFRELRHLRDQLGLEHLSMGMSGDYPIAIEEGATLLRVGAALFS